MADDLGYLDTDLNLLRERLIAESEANLQAAYERSRRARMRSDVVMSNADNDPFVVSVHALERFEERFPEIWNNDNDVGMLIYQETMDALTEGRVASVPPLELAANDITRWQAANSRIAWVPEKSRGYVLVDGYDGMTVATVLTGRPASEARSRLYGERKRRQGK